MHTSVTMAASMKMEEAVTKDSGQRGTDLSAMF